MKSILFFLSLVVVLVLPAQAALSQEQAKKNAVIAFDIRGDQLIKTETFAKIFVDGSMVGMIAGIDVMPQRVFGAASLPQDFAFIKAERPPEELPFDFFARIMANEKGEADDLIDMMRLGAKDKEISGRKYSVVGPELLLHQPDEKSIEIGNQAYVLPQSRRFFTPRLNKAFAATPDVPIRIAMDLETQKESVAQMIDLQIEQLDGLDPAARGLAEATLNCFKNLSELRIGIGLKSENLISVEAVGYDEAKALEFKEALDSVVGLGQLSSKPMAKMIRGQSKQLGDDFETMLANAAVTIDGTLVRLVVPAPANFDKTLASTINLAPSMGASGEAEVFETVYDTEPMPVFDSSQRLSGLEETISKKFQDVCFPEGYWGDDMVVKVDPIDLPNLNFYEFEYKVVSVKSKDGKIELLRKDEKEPKDKMQRLWMNGTNGSDFRLPVTLDGIKLESTKDKDGKELNKRQIADLKKEQLGSAEIEVFVKGMDSVTVFELTEEDPRQEKDGVRVKIRSMRGSTVDVTFNGQDIELYAFDETGKRIRRRGGFGTKGLKSSSFSGKPVKVKAVVFSGDEQAISFPVKIDLNGGKKLELPDEPSTEIPFRYTYGEQRTYSSVSQEQMDSLEVVHELVESGSSKHHKFFVDYPNPNAEIRFNWQNDLFGKDAAIQGRNHNAYSRNGQILIEVRKPHDGELPDIRRAFGKVEVTGSTGVETLTFEKQNDGEKINVTSESGKEFSVTMNMHQVSFTPSVDLIKKVFYDQTGKRLRYDQKWGSGESVYKCWGIPVKVEFIVRDDTITKTIDYEKEIGEVDQQAYLDFKKQQKTVSEIGHELAALKRIVQRAQYNYTVAGLHYVHGNGSDEPLNLISQELANSDPKAAELFGYEVKPYKGYHFTFPEKVFSSKKETPRVAGKKPEKVKWDGGEIESYRRLYSWGANGLLAWPADPKDPVIYTDNNQIYFRIVEDGKVDVLPDYNLLKQWTKGPPVSQPKQ